MDVSNEEYNSLTSTLRSFLNFYEYQYEQVVKPRVIKNQALTDEEQKLLPWYQKHIDNLKECLELSNEFSTTLALNVAKDWGVINPPQEWYAASPREFEITASTLLQLMREWSDEGKTEREISFKYIIDELESIYPELNSRPNVKILVPGCGLARIVFELVQRGFNTQGNEISYHMLLTSNFILNHCPYAHNYSIFPFLFKSSHLIKRSFQTRPVTIPDVSPFLINELQRENPFIPYDELMSITAGSFVDIYGENPSSSETNVNMRDTFDVVVTNFFLDTASNIIEYLKTIRHALKPNGKWINFGPWLWHFESDFNVTYTKVNNEGEKILDMNKGLELSREDVIELVKNLGFKIEKHESNIKSSYCKDIKSLGSFEFDCDFWVCTKLE